MQGSVASVIAAIREEAAAEVERVERASAAEIARLRDEAANADVSIADREVRLAAARRANAEKLAQEEWEARRAVIEQREEWTVRVAARGRELLRDADVRPLIAEAEQALPPGARNVRHAGGGGVIVACGDVTFDNSFDARARRYESEWRKALSEVYR